MTDMYTRCLTLLVAVMVPLGGMLPLVAAAPPPKVEVCHFQEETGTWKRLSIGAPALRAHLRNHDDALPGGVTVQSDTPLDADCAVVPAPCPCEGLTNPPAVWSAAFPAGSCVSDPVTEVLTVRTAGPDSAGILELLREDGICAVSLGVGLPRVEETGLSIAESAGCELSLRQIAAGDGVICVEAP
jgi:hypothetical protein